jgi:hypothetical protein
VLVTVEVHGLDDATIMQRLHLTESELKTFKPIWRSGDRGTRDIPVDERNKRKYVYFLKKKLEKMGMTVISMKESGRYVFPLETHKKIATILSDPADY